MKTKFIFLCLFAASAFLFVSNQSSAQWSTAGNNLAGGERLGSLNNQPVNFVTNNTSRMIIDIAGRVGIGTTAPINIFTVKGSGGTPAGVWAAGNPLFYGFGENAAGNADFILSLASNNAAARPGLAGRRSRGTLAAPTAVVNNDYLVSLVSSGFDGTNFQQPSGMEIFVDGAVTPGNVPSRISFVTGSNSGNRLERLKVGSTGNFDFNAGQMFLQQSTGNLNLSTGNLNFAKSTQTIQFPSVEGVANNPMINMFSAGTQSKDRMVIAHSPAYTNWGLQYQDSLDKFNFLSGGTPVLTTDLGTWRVGVGTSTPATRLDIAGTGAFNLATSEGDFRLGDATHRLKMGVANAGGGAGDAYIASSGRLYLGTQANLGRTQTMSINSNGTVGIGTATPAARLHVVGDTLPTTVLSVTGSYSGLVDVRGISSVSKPADGYGYGIEATGGYRGGYFFGNGGAYTGSVIGAYGIATGTAGTHYGIYGSSSGGDAENNWGGYFPTKTYTSELRVGGITGATGYVAAINGKLIATEVRVDLVANWPDYVFQKGYKLMPLKELEAKLNADKHLPGVPSAEEMKKSGIMLGEMQTKTMEKVEENTLYILQLNNKIKELESKIDALTKLIK